MTVGDDVIGVPNSANAKLGWGTRYNHTYGDDV